MSITIYFSFKKVRVESPRPCSSVNIRNCIQLNGDITTNTSHLQQQQHLMIESSSPISRQTTNNNRDRINNNTTVKQTTTYYSTRTGVFF